MKLIADYCRNADWTPVIAIGLVHKLAFRADDGGWLACSLLRSDAIVQAEHEDTKHAGRLLAAKLEHA